MEDNNLNLSPEMISIKEEIDEMFKVDQEARNRAATCQKGEGSDEIENLDKKHTERMKEIVAKYGWLNVSKVGKETSNQAWLLVQHADRDVQFQKECLTLMQAEPEGEVRKVDIAYLVDRVRVNEGLPQIYGTQFWTNNGVFGPRPIEDGEHVDERRAELGIWPMAEYEKIMRERIKPNL